MILTEFVDDLSNWYVRRSRPRFWGTVADGASAYATLHRCLVTTAQLLAPFCPFVADELYVTLTGRASVHLSDWPQAEGTPDRAGIEQMAAARRLVGLGRAARSEARTPVRQPLRRAFLLHPEVELSDEIRREITDELNVKALEEVTSLAELMTWRVVPNFRTLGPRLGPRVNEVKAALATADGAEARSLLETQGWFEVAGERLGPDDVEIRADRHEELALAQDGGWAVALDLELDEALVLEGTARALIRSLNDLRKRVDLALTDRIELRIDPGGPRVTAALGAHGDWVATEVLATALVVGDVTGGAGPDGHALDVDGESLLVELHVTG